MKRNFGRESGVSNEPPPIGCTAILIGINVTVMGLVAASLAQGPYSSSEQEYWYRYGSLGFLFAGGILPAILVASGARRAWWLPFALNVWMILALLGWSGYILMSGGGV